MADDTVPEFQLPPGRDVFISYASQDKAVAESVCRALENAGLVCWIAPRDVVPGESFAGAIVHAIDGTKVIVLVLSEHAATSQHVLREVERASSKRHPVIAFRIDLAPMPADFEYFLNTSQWLDASAPGVKHALPKLVDAVKIALTQPLTGVRAHPGSSVVAKSKLRPSHLVVALAAVVASLITYFVIDNSRLSGRVAPAAHASTPSLAAAPTISDKSVAVLPFVDMSEKHDQEYLSDGLSEELIDMLTKVPDLRVPARTSSFYFKGKPDDIATIASRLRVAHVLEGSVRKSGKNLRITVQLIRADNGYHMWSQTYDRELNDIFRVQDEIAGAVVGALKVSLLGIEPPRAVPARNSEAYTLYLQGRSMFRNANTHADDERALTYLRKAVQLDPEYAPAWAALAIHRCDDASFYGINLDQQARNEVRDAATQALALDPNLSDAHFAKGACLYQVDWDWKAGEAELRRALDLDPLNTEALLTLSNLLVIQDAHSSEALELAKRAVDRDPLYAYYYYSLSIVYFYHGDFTEAERAMRKALDLSPTADGVRGGLAYLLVHRGDAALALKELEREPNEQYRESLRPQILDALGRSSEADRALAALEAKYANQMPYEIAAVYAGRKDRDRAFSWLDRAYRQRESGLAAIRIMPEFSSIKSDPRYRALLNKLNLPE